MQAIQQACDWLAEQPEDASELAALLSEAVPRLRLAALQRPAISRAATSREALQLLHADMTLMQRLQAARPMPVGVTYCCPLLFMVFGLLTCCSPRLFMVFGLVHCTCMQLLGRHAGCKTHACGRDLLLPSPFHVYVLCTAHACNCWGGVQAARLRLWLTAALFFSCLCCVRFTCLPLPVNVA